MACQNCPLAHERLVGNEDPQWVLVCLAEKEDDCPLENELGWDLEKGEVK